VRVDRELEVRERDDVPLVLLRGWYLPGAPPPPPPPVLPLEDFRHVTVSMRV